MINEDRILRIENGFFSTCVEIRMSLEDFLKVAEGMRWLVQKFSAFGEIKVYANDGLNLCACWTYIPNEQSKAIYWSGNYEKAKIQPQERTPINLDAISQQLIAGSVHSVPLYVGLEFAKERISWKADKQTMQEAIDDMKFVRDQMKEINEYLNKELGHLSAKNDQLIHDLNEQVIALESLLKALGRKPITNNLALDLAIAITELQARGTKNV